MAEGKKEITVKRVSAFKFEIAISVGTVSEQLTTTTEAENAGTEDPTRIDQSGNSQNRISVIRRAPPSSSSRVAHIHQDRTGSCACECRRCGNCQAAPSTAILIEDAILYRIIEILLWRVLGENYLNCWGYPKTPTYRLLWNVVHYYSCFQPGAMTSLQQDHDCQGDINCFMDHVEDFLHLCAPTREVKEKFGWWRLSRKEILKKIYQEDLLPFLMKSDLANHPNILHSHHDILRLQGWHEQGFTAISWNGHEHFSRLKSRFPWCLQCCRRLRKSVISY